MAKGRSLSAAHKAAISAALKGRRRGGANKRNSGVNSYNKFSGPAQFRTPAGRATRSNITRATKRTTASKGKRNTLPANRHGNRIASPSARSMTARASKSSATKSRVKRASKKR